VEATNNAISTLVRGRLGTYMHIIYCPAAHSHTHTHTHTHAHTAPILVDIFNEGFRSWKLFGSYHPWNYLEEYGQQEGLLFTFPKKNQ